MELEAKIRCCLEVFANDLWIKRRLELDPIEELIKSSINEYSRENNNNNRGDVLIGSQWIRFIKFLGLECGGHHFDNDKQWSELMNLMQISKKLNHRSVKFKDIIRNKQLIEANEQNIRRFNESVRITRTLDSSLKQLESLINNECILILLPSQPDLQQQQQQQQIEATKRFLDDRCQSILYTLQIELNAESDAVDVKSTVTTTTASGGPPQNQQSLAKCQRLQAIVSGLSDFLADLRELNHQLAQLDPLINVELTSALDAQSNTKAEKPLENSIESCKRIFSQVQEFKRTLLAHLCDVAASSSNPSSNLQRSDRNRKRAFKGGTSKEGTDFVVELNLIKLINSNGQLARGDLLVSSLKEALLNLQECRSTLDSVMHNLRLEFGRFYFVSDLELLTIIALDSRLITDDPGDQQKGLTSRRLLGKLFNNSIEGFVLDENKKQIIGVKSPQNSEIILFPLEQVGPVLIKKSFGNLYSVEIVRILQETLRKLRKTLKYELHESLKLSSSSSSSKIQSYTIDWSLPVQLMNLAEQIKFCEKVEGSLFKSESSIEEVLEFYEDRFKKLSSPEGEGKQGEHFKVDSFKLSAAISTTVHFMSTLGKLRSVVDVHDWRWLRQLRYYKKLDKDGKFVGDVEVRIANTCFDYKFDFLAPQTNDSSRKSMGAFKRLIGTQITERCLIAASQSMGNFRLGSSPFGPAGSGKTETIKALGVALGCQVIVHNCDESNDGQSLEQLIWGLAHTGIWGCFDEFNRLSASALSSISASLELVQASIRESKHMVELPDNRMMPVNESTAFFVTMNPVDANKGYRGRRRLPANLRQLFLPIAMTRVQVEAIVSESLLALGAELKGRLSVDLDSAKALGDKLATLMNELATEPLSNNYGSGSTCAWDLRLVMATLKRLKLLAVSTERDFISKRDFNELQRLLFQSIKQEIKPRLSGSDLNTFQRLLGEKFPVAIKEAHESDDETLKQRLKEELLKRSLGSLTLREATMEHAIQLKRLLETRSGVILLGPSKSGKSTCWRSLYSIQQQNSIAFLPLNPRACRRESLFGWINPITRKWVDGLFTIRVRQALDMLMNSSSSSQVTSINEVWLILDGPIDPDWVESFNSVLDDNQVLTLSSGERLSFTPAPQKCIKLIIESDSIKFASPATISRLGLVLHEPPVVVVQEDNSTRTKYFITKSGELSKESLHLARSLLFTPAGNEKSLLVIAAPAGRQNIRSKFIQEILSNYTNSSQNTHNDMKVIEFNCSPLSDCNQLLDNLLTCNTDGQSYDKSGEDYLFVINNIHLIEEEEDQWGVRSFIELLRFVVTYGGFYDKQFEFRNLKARFIVTLDSFDHVDSRLLAQGNLIELEIEANCMINDVERLTVDTKKFNLGQLVETRLSNNPIVTLSSSHYGFGRRDRIIEHFKNNTKNQIMSFRNSGEASRSIEVLEELLSNKLNFFKKGSSSKQEGNTKVLFLLNDLECKLMKPELRSHLFYLLNRLNNNTKKHLDVVNFVFLTHDKANNLDDTITTFWRSFGPILHLHLEVIPFQAREDLHKLIREQLGANRGQESDWFIKKVTNLYESDHLFQVKEMLIENCSLLDAFIYTTLQLVKNSRAELEHQRVTFGEGLSRLEEFERQVEEIKSRCQKEEIELIRRKDEISFLMGDIDRALREASSQKVELNKLKEKQLEKQEEIKVRSEQLERELLEVSKLVDRSKTEVSQFLKPEALQEIKALRSPPSTIKDILDVLFTLLKIEDCSWTSMRSHLNKYSLRDELTNYDFRKNLNQSLLERATSLMESKRVSFSEQQAGRASKAIVPILGWIKATLEYGRVLIRLRPLNEQMSHFETEANTLSEQAHELEIKLIEVDTKIEIDSSRLAKLKQNFEESSRVATTIKRQLERAQLARSNLEGQIGRWRQRLTWIKSQLGENSELLAVCSVVVGALILFPQHNSNNLESWMSLFDINLSSSSSSLRVDFATKTLSLLLPGLPETWLKAEEANQVLQFVGMRLSLDLELAPPTLRIPPLFVDSSSTRAESLTLNQAELAQYLASKGLLCRQAANVSIIRCDQFSEWRQSIELALRLNKLVVVELNEDDSSLDLDIMDYVFSKTLSTVSASSSSSSSADRVGNKLLVLFGNLNKHPAIRSLVRPIKLLTGSSSLDEFQSSVMSYLLDLREPELSNLTQKLEVELQMKQQESRQRELRLLSQLATTSSIRLTSSSGEQMSLRDDLVGVLDELRQLSESLKVATDQLGTRQNELRVKQERYEPIAREVAQFYLDHLADLSKQNKFYNLSLEAYLHLLIDTNNNYEEQTNNSCEPYSGNNSTFVLNYERVVRWATRPMRPEFRLQFERRLMEAVSSKRQQQQQQVSGDGDASLRLSTHNNGKQPTRGERPPAKRVNEIDDKWSLEGSVMKLLHDISGSGNSSNKSRCRWVDKAIGPNRLMVVLHEPTKSSPQLEIDELFRRQETSFCVYSKYYATSNSFDRLESIFNGIMVTTDTSKFTVAQNSGLEVEKIGGERTRKLIRCLCIANAHLASKWLNLRLPQILTKASNQPATGEVAAKNLIILIGECCSNTDVEFDSSLLDFAQVKYWHDDSMLELTNRFRLFSRSLLTNQWVNSYLTANQQRNNKQQVIDREQLLEMTEQLVLFHVVCQEGAKGALFNEKPSSSSPPPPPSQCSVDKELKSAVGSWFWCHNYSFDYDQLHLAFKSLANLLETAKTLTQVEKETTNKSDHLRELFCHYLADFVYGARMESLDDELKLNRLIQRFLGSRESGRRQLNRFKQLEATLERDQTTEYKQQLSDLICGI